MSRESNSHIIHHKFESSILIFTTNSCFSLSTCILMLCYMYMYVCHLTVLVLCYMYYRGSHTPHPPAQLRDVAHDSLQIQEAPRAQSHHRRLRLPDRCLSTTRSLPQPHPERGDPYRATDGGPETRGSHARSRSQQPDIGGRV